MNDVGNFPMAGGCYTKWHAARLELVRQASLPISPYISLYLRLAHEGSGKPNDA